MSNGFILLKGPCISPNIAPRGLECETTCRKSWPWNLFQVLNLAFKVKWGHHTKTSLLSVPRGTLVCILEEFARKGPTYPPAPQVCLPVASLLVDGISSNLAHILVISSPGKIF